MEVVRKVLLLSLLILLMLPFLNACAKEPVEIKKVINIGSLVDLTGPISYLGSSILESQADYIKWINEEERLPGIRVGLVWRDTGYSLPKAITSYRAMKEEGIVALVTVSSTENEGLKSLLEKDRIPLVSPAVSTPALVPPGWVFVDRANYADTFAAFLDWLLKEHWQEKRAPRLGILTWDSAMGRAILLDECYEYADKVGVEIVGSEFMPMMPLDLTAQLMRLRDAQADFIYSNVAAEACSAVIRECHRLGLLDKGVTVVGPGQFGYEDVISLTREASEGFIQVMYAAQWFEDLPGVKLMRELQMKYRGEADEQWGYLASIPSVMVICEALELASKELGYEEIDGEAIKSILESGHVFDTMGITPPLSYGPEIRQGISKVRIGQIQGGDLEVLTDWFETPCLLGRL